MDNVKRVLVIDDEEDFCGMIKDFLETSGNFEVSVLTDSRRSMLAAKEFKPEIILLDILMPHVGGLEVCRLLSSDKKTCCIPVIVATGSTDDSDVKGSFQMGASAFISKPIALENLILQIKSVLHE